MSENDRLEDVVRVQYDGWTLDEDLWWTRSRRSSDFDIRGKAMRHFGFTMLDRVWVRTALYAMAYDRHELVEAPMEKTIPTEEKIMIFITNSSNVVERVAYAMWAHNGKPFDKSGSRDDQQICRTYYMAIARVAINEFEHDNDAPNDDAVLDLITTVILEARPVDPGAYGAKARIRETIAKPIIDRLTKAGYAVGSFK